jgi:BlaI family penicillinase repressor
MSVKKMPKISDAEWQVMKVIWEREPVTSSDIVEMLKPVTKWSPTTIYTLINRLVNKKAVSIEEGTSPYVCRTLISREEIRMEESRSFLRKVFDGSLNLMLANFVEEQGLSEKEIDELKSILEKGKDKGR